MAVDEILLIVHQVYPRKIMQLLPDHIRAGIRALVYTVLEAWESIFVIRDPMIPRRRLRTRFCTTIDVSEYRNAGEVFLRIFTQYGNLKPDEHVLEIGSGCGRAALPLTGYLSLDGSYDGLEIQRDGFQWCLDAIAGRHPNFHFTFADVYNKDYNPHGAITALEYRFPYADESFDFIFMTSVFTHMLPGDVKHYLEEISRVLKQDGRCLMTYFLWNAEIKSLHDAGKSVLCFSYDHGPFLTIDPGIPELAVAYREDYILKVIEDTGLVLVHAPLYGSWCGRTNSVTGQDILVVRKRMSSLESSE